MTAPGRTALTVPQKLIAGGKQPVVRLIQQDDEAGLDEGKRLFAGGKAEALGAGLGDGGHHFLAAFHAQDDLIVDGAAVNGGHRDRKDITGAGSA